MAASKTKKPALRQISRPNGAGPSKIWRSGEMSRPNGAARTKKGSNKIIYRYGVRTK